MAIADDMEYIDAYEEWCEDNAEPIYELGQVVGYVMPNGTIREEVEDNFT